MVKTVNDFLVLTPYTAHDYQTLRVKPKSIDAYAHVVYKKEEWWVIWVKGESFAVKENIEAILYG